MSQEVYDYKGIELFWENTMFHGTITALITPFKNGTIDEEAYRAHIEWQIEQGVNGLVPCGTTGESATMSHAEHEAAIRICVDQVKGRVPVIAGAGVTTADSGLSFPDFSRSGRPFLTVRGPRIRKLSHPHPLGDNHVSRYHHCTAHPVQERRHR